MAPLQCPACKFKMGFLTDTDLIEGVAHDGTLIVCTGCGAASRATESGALRLLSADDIATLPTHQAVAYAHALHIVKVARVRRQALNN